MNHANIGLKVYSNDLSILRHRKFHSADKLCSNEMVGLNSQELLRSNISNVTMELEMKSDDETESDGEPHTRRLIPSPIDHRCVKDNNDHHDDGDGDGDDIDNDNDDDDHHHHHHHHTDKQSIVIQTCKSNRTEEDNLWSTSIQMFVPFLLAGFGMVAASLLLDVVQVRKDALARLSNGIRSIYIGASVAGFKRKFGDDVGLPIFDSRQSRLHRY